MQYVRVQGGKPEPFRLTRQTFYREVSPVCCRWPLSLETLAEHGLFPLDEDPKPTPGIDQHVDTGPIVRRKGRYVRTWTLRDYPRAEHAPVTPRQLQLALIEAGLDEELEAAIAALPAKEQKRLRVELASAEPVGKESPLTRAVQSALVRSDAQMDVLWEAARAE